jgi:benzoyl-CoA reductase/2-hydroxyglutaryl-CoA dehydratase subunit BcrC/BadD/HgdB
MDITTWFGGRVTELAQSDPDRARRLLLTGYRANLMTLRSPKSARSMTPSERFAAIAVMELIIKSLTRPGDAAMVSLFTPCELLFAAGLSPYSLEAVSGYLMGARCETRFQDRSAADGVPETMCSFHRTFLGAADTGLMPQPRFIVYTSLACDGNMVTFPYLEKKYGIPCFFIDVPYEKTEDAVRDVARQLKSMVEFVEDSSSRIITPEALSAAVRRSRLSRESYWRRLGSTASRHLKSDVTGEMYSAFMSHILLGSDMGEKYFSLLERDTAAAPESDAKRLLWIHTVPYMQPALRRILNFSDRAFITACDLCYDSMTAPQDENDPYTSMAARLVYSGYNGSVDGRIENALKTARLTNSDGAVIFAHWGCKATLGASKLMKDALEAEGLPALILDGDACAPANTGDGQLATRLEAFLEMLEAK